MNTSETSVARLGFDLRGLMAVTSVAAFISLASKVDLGSAIVLAAIFTSCALMAHFHPVGSVRRHRTMGLMFLLGIAIALCACAVQYFVFGFRVYVMLGTAMATCFGVASAAVVLCKPTWMLWAKRCVLGLSLLLCSYLVLHCILYRDSLRLSLHHEVYYVPRFKFTEGTEYYAQNWLLNRLRFAFGLMDMRFLDIQPGFSNSDLRALFNVGALSSVRFNGCTVDLPPGLMFRSGLSQGIGADSLAFSSCRLQGASLGALIDGSTAKYMQLENCEVASFEGLAGVIPAMDKRGQYSHQ
jgi:hypothetical protein